MNPRLVLAATAVSVTSGSAALWFLWSRADGAVRALAGLAVIELAGAMTIVIPLAIQIDQELQGEMDKERAAPILAAARPHINVDMAVTALCAGTWMGVTAQAAPSMILVYAVYQFAIKKMLDIQGWLGFYLAQVAIATLSAILSAWVFRMVVS
jgi:hypothetical protein